MRPGFVLRRSNVLKQRIFTRNASSGTDGAQKKAQDALAGAQKQASQIWGHCKRVLEPAGQRLSGLLGSYQQPLFYNLAVSRELVKQIYRAEKLSPPSLGAIQSAYFTIFSRALSPAFWRESIGSGEILRIGVYGLEAYGIFKIGEILGRRSLIGYNIQ